MCVFVHCIAAGRCVDFRNHAGGLIDVQNTVADIINGVGG